MMHRSAATTRVMGWGLNTSERIYCCGCSGMMEFACSCRLLQWVWPHCCVLGAGLARAGVE
jgi:hypothetical protein